MDYVTRRFNGQMTKFPIYSLEEATQKKIPFKENWREAKLGDYIATDDGYVAEVLRVRPMKSGDTELTFPFGRAFLKQKMAIQYLAHKANKSYHHASGEHELVYECRKARMKRLVSAYVGMLARGKVDYERLAYIYRQDQEVPNIKIILKNRAVKRMIEQEMKEVLSSHGVTKDYAITKLKKAMDIAEAKEDAKTMMLGVDKALELLGEKNRKVSLTQSISGTFPGGLIDKMEEKISMERSLTYDERVSQSARKEEPTTERAEYSVEGEVDALGED